jgi:flagellar hook protein FlgE
MIHIRDLCSTVLLGGGIFLASLHSTPAGLRPLYGAASGIVATSPGLVPLESGSSNPPVIGIYDGLIIRDLTTPDADGIVQTGVGTDLAIRGAGWFVLRVPAEGVMAYTRAGDFRLDWEGYLITARGYRVQGFNQPGSSAVGDLQIDGRFFPATTDPAATITTFTIDRDGYINVHMSDGTEFRRGQILLQDFAAPDELERIEYQFVRQHACRAAGKFIGGAGHGELGRNRNEFP